MFSRLPYHSHCFPVNCLPVFYFFLNVRCSQLGTASMALLSQRKTRSALNVLYISELDLHFSCVTLPVGLLHVSPSSFLEEQLSDQ